MAFFEFRFDAIVILFRITRSLILLPYTVKHLLAYLDERIRFFIEETPLFKSNFLVCEGFIDIKNFTVMFGMVGLAEIVNHFVENSEKLENRFGHSENADEPEIHKHIIQAAKFHKYFPSGVGDIFKVASSNKVKYILIV